MNISKKNRMIDLLKSKYYLHSKLNSDQKPIFNAMQEKNRLSILMPTGTGKGFIMISDIQKHITDSSKNIFVISTHRLMLNNQHLSDIFDKLKENIGEIGYIFVGSQKFDASKYQEFSDLNTTLLKQNLNYNDIIKTTTSTKDVDLLTKEHLSKGRNVIIVTTYHSLDKLKNLDIHTIYSDEAHMLASEEYSANFKKNFEKIKSDRYFFFTATPKDCVDEETESFLMNNSKIFGERIGITFKAAVDNGRIARPIIHIAHPENEYKKEGDLSIENYAKFIIDAYEAHTKYIWDVSFDKSMIAPKILVKCPSVDIMWEIHNYLTDKVKDIKICAGASRCGKNSASNHMIDDIDIEDRNDYLRTLQSFKDNEKVIVLHFDILSEGINVPGFTGVMFLDSTSKQKLLQNIGRSTRLHQFDRDRLDKNEINADDYTKWVKPSCVVIIPYWDSETEMLTNKLAKDIRSLRDDFGFDPKFLVSIGSDIGDGEYKPDLEGLNKKDKKDKKSDLIEEIRNEIEKLDQIEKENKEDKELNSLSKLQLLKKWQENKNKV